MCVYSVYELGVNMHPSGELIMSKYVAESIAMIAGRFSHEGLCQLHKKQFCTQLTKGFVAKTSCNHCY